jgi:hypothetical protein
MVWKTILATAIQTPSPHNVQPWKVRIRTDSEADLLIDSSRTLPKEDVTGSFILLAMGMFTESVSILAKSSGFNLTFEISDVPELARKIITDTQRQLIPFATLRLSKSEYSTVDYPAELFFKRRTSRLSLRPDLISDSILKTLTDLALSWDQIFRITTEPAQIERLMKLNTKALFSDLNTKDYHDEIIEWFRFSDFQSRERSDGLDYRCMNTPRPIFWMSANLPWLMKVPLLGSVLGETYRSQLGTIPTIGFLSGAFWDPAEAIDSGRFLMRFWLELAKHDLYIHPFGNLVTNRPIAAKVEQEMNLKNIWLVFKIGYSPEPIKSRRLPLETILVR